MKIEFEIGTDNQEVLIKSNGKEIGHIFTPASTGHDVLNAIQICGFEEAYDYWGCGIFGEKITYKQPLSADMRRRIKEYLKSDAIYYKQNRWYYRQMLARGYEEKTKTVMKKDIQLLFKDYTNVRDGYGSTTDCWACFNSPCTCDQETSKIASPYVVKRQVQLEEDNQIWQKLPESKKKENDVKD